MALTRIRNVREGLSMKDRCQSLLQSHGVSKFKGQSYCKTYVHSRDLMEKQAHNSDRPIRSILPKPNQAPLIANSTLPTTNRTVESHSRIQNKKPLTSGINTTSRLHDSNWKIVNTEGSQSNPYLKHTQETSRTVRVFGPNRKRHFLSSPKDQALFERQRTIIYALNAIMRDYEQAQYEAFMKSREMH
ncbi:hypothetical protein EG68_10004 [Paragonimus skrjabini miyazakii]|uniref:Uncharacterized protein n=1 Tax=Paragonimus skrjabini miyazakii TaxID=59628 RepID=A0A8S9YT28_9TREM|nr:hypothetical protein EG68_10004 [Paragonimus skrjabini miyazakii]